MNRTFGKWISMLFWYEINLSCSISFYNRKYSFHRIFLYDLLLSKCIITSLPSWTCLTVHYASSVHVISHFSTIWTMIKWVFFKTTTSISPLYCTISWRNQFDSAVFTSVLILSFNCVCLDLVKWRRNWICVMNWFIEVVVRWLVICCCVYGFYSWVQGFWIARLAIGWVSWRYIKTLIETSSLIFHALELETLIF